MGFAGTKPHWIISYVGKNKNIEQIAAEQLCSIEEVLQQCAIHVIDPIVAFGFDPSKHKDSGTHWIIQYICSGKPIQEVAKEQKVTEGEVLTALLAIGKQQADLQIGGKRLIGLDVGTSKLLSANRAEDGSISIRAQRNAFMELKRDTATMRALKRQMVNYVEVEGKLFLVGDNAYDYGNVFPHLELKRPMANGMLSIDPNALPIIKEIIGALIGEAESNSICAYSVPAAPVDIHKLVQFHTDVIEGILKLYGYTPIPVNEGVAVANVGLEQHDLTGLALSFGGGLINACLMFKGLSALQISVSHAGDFIDGMAAKDVGLSPIQMTSLKETDTINISETQTTRESQALKSYYILCIRHALSEIAKYFNAASDKPHFTEPIHVACAGGGVLIPGFAKVFEQEFKAMDMPFEVAENGVSIVEDPLGATAKGCLIEAELA